MEDAIQGSNWNAESTTQPAKKGLRFAADIIDLLIIPAVLGGIFGLVLIAAPDLLRDLILTVVYVGWIFFRDLYFSPGRRMVSWVRQIFSSDKRAFKLVSIGGNFGSIKYKTAPASLKPNFLQIFIRNLLIYPYILVLGYLTEFTFIFFVTGPRRKVYGWIMIVLGILIVLGSIRNLDYLFFAVIGAELIVLGSLVISSYKLGNGDRLMDRLAHTRIVIA